MGCCTKETEIDKPSNERGDILCPRCKFSGVKVKLITLQHLLKDSCQSKIDLESDYKFCKNSKCEVTYYSISNNFLLTKDQLKVKATLKDKGLDVNVCYCFGHTRQSVLDEIKETGFSTVLDDIKEKMKDPGCFCEISNPQGGCCLANNIAWIKEAKNVVDN